MAAGEEVGDDNGDDSHDSSDDDNNNNDDDDGEGSSSEVSEDTASDVEPPYKVPAMVCPRVVLRLASRRRLLYADSSPRLSTPKNPLLTLHTCSGWQAHGKAGRQLMLEYQKKVEGWLEAQRNRQIGRARRRKGKERRAKARENMARRAEEEKANAEARAEDAKKKEKENERVRLLGRVGVCVCVWVCVVWCGECHGMGVRWLLMSTILAPGFNFFNLLSVQKRLYRELAAHPIRREPLGQDRYRRSYD